MLFKIPHEVIYEYEDQETEINRENVSLGAIKLIDTIGIFKISLT